MPEYSPAHTAAILYDAAARLRAAGLELTRIDADTDVPTAGHLCLVLAAVCSMAAQGDSRPLLRVATAVESVLDPPAPVAPGVRAARLAKNRQKQRTRYRLAHGLPADDPRDFRAARHAVTPAEAVA